MSYRHWSFLLLSTLLLYAALSSSNDLQTDTLSAFQDEYGALQAALHTLSVCDRKGQSVLLNYTKPAKQGDTRSKYAVVYTGASRTFHFAWPSHYKAFIDRQAEDVDLYFYVNIRNDSSPLVCQQFISLLVLPQLRRLVIEIEDIANVTERVKAAWMPSYPYPMVQGPDSSPVHLVNHLYYNNAGWGILTDYVKLHRPNDPYNFVVRVRPDLYFPTAATEWISLAHIDNTIREQQARFDTAQNEMLITPNCCHFGGMNDQIAIMSWMTASKYYTTLKMVEGLCTQKLVRFHPETLLLYSLSRDESAAWPSYYKPLEDFYARIAANSTKASRAGHARFSGGQTWPYIILRNHADGLLLEL